MSDAPETEDRYDKFLTQMGDILKQTLPATSLSRNRLEEAEAEEAGLRSRLAIAEARVALLRTRYNRDRDILMEMWETWRSEFIKENDHAREIAAAKEASDD